MSPPMAQNGRPGTGWSQVKRLAPAKSRVGCSRGSDIHDLGGLGDVTRILSSGDRSRYKREHWSNHQNVLNSHNYSTGDCCLKNGRVQCQCFWPKRNYLEEQKSSNRKFGKSTILNESSSFENEHLLRHDKSSFSSHFPDDKIAEEFILDDNELSLLNFYDIPIDFPRKHQLRKVGKVKTVSIIDTLSELASGATDREDEGTFSSAVSESAILNVDSSNFAQLRTKHNRNVPMRQGRMLRENSLLMPSPSCSVKDPLALSNPDIGNGFDSYHGISYNSHLNSLQVDDANFPCSSLKRTLKYLRKAVSSNVVQEEPRVRRYTRRHEEKDAFRLCLSDSEVREAPGLRLPTKHYRQELSPHTKSRSMFMVTSPTMEQYDNFVPVFRGRQKADVPEWIQDVFTAAKKGDVIKLREGLKDIDSALVRNLCDYHGNNLWHTCAAYNHIPCLEWLCSQSGQQAEALGDENKHGFTPAALAIKHGSLLSVQWLIHNTNSKSQLTPPSDSRSLLHIAAKYGQETIVQWLLVYMQSQDIDINCLDSEGNTPLHLASKHGNIACVKALLFHNGNLKVRNERGLKPLNLAIKYSQTDCADYLLAVEACYNLAASNLHLESDVQQLQKENLEIKSYFKELLNLTKRLQHRQRELVQTFSVSRSNEFVPLFDADKPERSRERVSKHLDDYSQLLATVLTDEEHRLMMIEERWKKLRKQIRMIDSKKSALDIIRVHFSQILEKVTYQSPAVPSTPETSDDSLCSGDDEPLPPVSQSLLPHSTYNFSMAPDVLHMLPNIPSHRKRQMHKEKSTLFNKSSESETTPETSLHTASISKKKSNFDIKTSTVRTITGTARDVNLQMFFKQNPNLRQASETCSVLEVLEPSSSDSEECIKHKKVLVKNLSMDKNREFISSSSVIETCSPSSSGLCSSVSKTSGSRSSSNESRVENNGLSNNGNAQDIIHTSESILKQHINDSDITNSEHLTAKDLNKEISHSSSCEDNCSVEPDLIKGTQKRKNFSYILQENEMQSCKEGNGRLESSLTDNPSISTEDSESLEVDRSFCSAVDIPESVLQSSNIDSSVTGTGVKKKSFLLKFALRGRWPSKHRPRSLKNEISPDDFRETYSRSSTADNATPASQCVFPGDLAAKKFPKVKDSEKRFNDCQLLDTSCSVEKLEEGKPPIPSRPEVLRQAPLRTASGLLPPRRDPPPAPPLLSEDGEVLHPHSGLDGEVSIQKGSSVSCSASSLASSSVPRRGSYIAPSSSDMWPSPDSKSLFRPASSASRVESPSRGEESFTLNKSCSASTEMLSALDSSTAGRQSPAPSEVSKTESALSPPSDVSKTESTRYLSQLGKIEESNHLAAMKSSSTHQKVSDEGLCSDSQQNKEERSEIKVKKKSGSSKKEDTYKPWYEFSDEEDIIMPQRYKAVAVAMRSSSEDEEIVTS